MRRKLITIRDVAERAGVSVSTVSHVLNGNDQHVGMRKRERVLEVVGELGYRPNAIARSMVRQKTATIGLVLTEIDNQLFIPVIAGIEGILRPAGYHIVLANAPDVENEMLAIETLRSQQVDGFIFMSLSLRYPFDHLLRLKDEGVPFVVINRYLENDDDINQVFWDDWGGGYAAATYLLGLGHRHIGTICGPLDYTPPRMSAVIRHQGWLQALREHHITPRSEWIVSGNYTYEGGYQAAQALLKQRESGSELPTALFAASDLMAVGALKAFHDGGVRIPHDLSIVAMGDPPFAAYTIPALTTLVLPVPEAGKQAADILLNWLTAGKPAIAQHITLNVMLQVRESCGSPQR